MADLSQVKNALDSMKKIEHVIEVSLVSRGGLFILGEVPKGVHEETYAAMSAILLGAAETTSAEMKNRLSHVSVKMTERNVLLLSGGNRYLLTITTDGKENCEEVVKTAVQIISKVDLNL